MQINELWNKYDETSWRDAEQRYWHLVKPSNEALERELESLDLNEVKRMDAEQFYEFLHGKYFVWKYTAPNRLATTRKVLQEYQNNLSSLEVIHKRLFSFDLVDIKAGLTVTKEIKGLGVAGASGLLALLFPMYFGTVDQFAVEALKKIDNLGERLAVERMKKENLTISNGVILINIMRTKASDLNKQFETNYWIPRKIDKILWATGR